MTLSESRYLTFEHGTMGGRVGWSSKLDVVTCDVRDCLQFPVSKKLAGSSSLHT